MQNENTKPVRTMIGKVVSNKMMNTIVVSIERKVPDKKYGTYVKRHTKIFADDPANQCNIGDTVSIKPTRPLSKKKSWALVDVLEASK